MGKPAARMGDSIVNAGDIHIVLIPSPGGPVPTPQPCPFNGRIQLNVSLNVCINGRGAALLGSVAQNVPPHIPQGGPFQVPPTNLGRVIMASTGLVYAADLPHPAREDDPTTAPMPYPASKVIAEQSLRESGLTWSILRFAFVYGDGDGHLQSAPELLGRWNWHPAATLSLIHHRDIAGAILLALDGVMDGKVVNLTDDAPATVAEIARVVGADYPESNKPLENPWNGHLDGTLARQLGFVPTIRSMYQAATADAL